MIVYAREKLFAEVDGQKSVFHKSSTAAWYLTSMIIIHLYAVFYFTFPAVSVTVAEEPELLQQIEISETTYHESKKVLDSSYHAQSLGLDDDGKTVCVVHQQDRSIKAQTTDWTGLKIRPYPHIGLPCEGFWAEQMHFQRAYPHRKLLRKKSEV